MATGFWCPLSGTIVDVTEKMLSAMPPVCLCGYLKDDHLTVTGFPHVTSVMPAVNPPNVFKPVRYFYQDPEKRASFMDELLLGPSLLEGTPCSVLKVKQLSEDPAYALSEFRDMPDDSIARHQWSTWSMNRDALVVSNTIPDVHFHCRIREIVCSEDPNLIDYVSVWRTVNIEDRVIPLYPGDEDINCDFWTPKNAITLYTLGDLVIGYE